MWLWWALLALLICDPGSASLIHEREVSVITWNVNGVKKLSYLPTALALLEQHDIALLQETFAYEDKDLLELRGFLGHHARAIPGERRNLWGLTTLFRTKTFADGFLERISSPCDWVLVSRWRQPGLPGLTVINIYAPLHTRLGSYALVWVFTPDIVIVERCWICNEIQCAKLLIRKNLRKVMSKKTFSLLSPVVNTSPPRTFGRWERCLRICCSHTPGIDF